jgi:hypothetical protein
MGRLGFLPHVDVDGDVAIATRPHITQPRDVGIKTAGSS